MNKREYPLSLKSSTPDRLIAIENALNDILKRFNVLDHHIEHELVSVEDHITNLGSKVNKREDSSDGRIEMLEETMTKKVDGTIAERLNHIERQIKGMYGVIVCVYMGDCIYTHYTHNI